MKTCLIYLIIKWFFYRKLFHNKLLIISVLFSLILFADFLCMYECIWEYFTPTNLVNLKKMYWNHIKKLNKTIKKQVFKPTWYKKKKNRERGLGKRKSENNGNCLKCWSLDQQLLT